MKLQKLLRGILLGISLTPLAANAKMCKAENAQGDPVFAWAKDPKTGKLMVTKSASGLIATMEDCELSYNLDIPAQTLTNVRLRPQDIIGLEIPTPIQTLPVDMNEFLHESCRRTLDAVCDPAYGAIKLNPNPIVDGAGTIRANCIGFKIEPGVDELGVTRYTNIQMYGGVNSRADGSQYCVFDESLQPLAPNPVSLPVVP